MATPWSRLCGLAVQVCGSQESFRKQANILRRLARQYGPDETARMLMGAKALKWKTGLTGLGTEDGVGRRWAVEAYWQRQKQGKPMQSLGSVLRRAMAKP